MSYLYGISMELYNKLLKYHEKNPNSFFPISEPSYHEREIKLDYRSIINNYDNYFHLFYKNYSLGFFDVDFFADIIDGGIYINSPRFNHRNGDIKCLEEYYNNENAKLLKVIRETIYTRHIMNSFIKKMRLYYLEDFLLHQPYSEDLMKVKNLYNKLMYLNGSDIIIKSHTTYEEILELVKNCKSNILDYCSELIDSNDFRNAVIEQQKYYIKEIERLEAIINEKGNITKYSDEEFAIYIEFMHIFKNEAINKVNKLSNERIMIKSLKGNRG